jgi:hypothetical protein
MTGERWVKQGLGPFELCGVMTVITVLATGLMLLGWTAEARTRATACASNLRQIATALTLYAHDYGGHFPSDAGALPAIAKVYVKNEQVLLCPKDHRGAALQRENRQRPSEQTTPETPTSYFTVPGYMTDDPPASVIAGDAEPRHEGQWNAACLDGRVVPLPGPELPRYRPQRSEPR